jgi:hypothetical protein
MIGPIPLHARLLHCAGALRWLRSSRALRVPGKTAAALIGARVATSDDKVKSRMAARLAVMRPLSSAAATKA